MKNEILIHNVFSGFGTLPFRESVEKLQKTYSMRVASGKMAK